MSHTQNRIQNDLSDKNRIIEEKYNLIKELRKKLKENKIGNCVAWMRKNSGDMSKRTENFHDINLQKVFNQIIYETIRGLTRLTMTSLEWHKKNKDAVNMLFGFPT